MRTFTLLAALAGLTVPLAPAPGRAQYPGAEEDANYNAMIDGWARRYLRRASVPRMNAPWVQAMESGTSPETILSGILGSPEYYNRAGGDDRRFVGRLIADVTGRPPAPREAAYLLDRLYQGEDRTQVVYEFLTRHPEGLEAGPPRRQPAHEYRRPYHRDYDH